MRISSSVRGQGKSLLSLAVAITVTVSCRDSALTHISLMSSLFLDFSLFLPPCGIVRGEGGNFLWLQQECSKVVLPVLWSSALQLELVITDETEAKSCRVGRVLLNCGVPQHFYSLSWLRYCGFMQNRPWCYSVCSFCLVSLLFGVCPGLGSNKEWHSYREKLKCVVNALVFWSCHSVIVTMGMLTTGQDTVWNPFFYLPVVALCFYLVFYSRLEHCICWKTFRRNV